MTRTQKPTREQKLSDNINYIAKVLCISLLYGSYRIYTESDLPIRAKVAVTALSSFGSLCVYIFVRLATRLALGVSSLRSRDEFSEEMFKEIEMAKESFEERLQKVDETPTIET